MSAIKPDLNSLASILEDQFSIGENKNTTLDTISPIKGRKVRYGALGEFASKFDQSQERRYLEQGYLRRDSFTATPRQSEITFQQPTATVLIKKRAFSSLAENFGGENLDKDERLFIKATKVLFQNKTIQIAAFEKLFKAQQILEKDASNAEQLMPLIISIVESSTKLFQKEESGTETAFSKLKSVTDKIKKLYAFNKNSLQTTWIMNPSNPFKSALGQGTGVMELNNVKNFTCSTSVSLNEGSCNISFSDPYNLMTITSYDIERAISDATNRAYNSSIYEFGKENLKISIADLKTQLNNRRAARGVSNIEFIVNPNTVLGKRIRAIIDGSGIEIPFEYNPFNYNDEDDLDNIQKVAVTEEYIIGGKIAGNEGLNNKKKNIRTIMSGYEGVSLDPTSKKRSMSEPGVSYRSILETSELTLFQDIIKNTFDLIALEANANENIKKSNEETNYVRRKLRLHYLGKSIVQPMDQIHVYIASRSKEDRKIIGGMQSSMKGLQYKQQINSIFNGISYGNNAIKGMFKPAPDLYTQIEKSVFVGDDFPNPLWVMFRDGFVNDNDGTHVFGGVITSSDSNYAGGSYSVTCHCNSMAEYFSQGRFNWKPSVNVFNGELLDPLTIWKTRFDSVSYDSENDPKQLLDENKALIESGTARYLSGHNVGQVVTIKNLISDEEVGPLGQKKKIIYEPDGLVHRWKEGIGTLTKHSMSNGNSRTSAQPSFYEEPFAGQDIMNIISILVTGIPYNFVTYYKAAIGAATTNLVKDQKDQKIESIQSQMMSLRNGISKNNIIWGNFVPFKNLTVTDEEVIKTINAQNSVLENNKNISSILASISKLNNTINLLTKRKESGVDVKAALDSAISRLGDAGKDLKKAQDDFNTQISNNKDWQNRLVIIGDSVTYDDGYLAGDNNGLIYESYSATKDARKKVRRKINFLTRRLARDVRSNTDKNLFIVDDNYDKDYDIWAFNIKLQNMQLFNSEYTTVKDKISKLSDFLDFEIFCDSQGNIRARSPQYNKMPSSVFFRLLKMKDEYGIELFPKFLTNLITDQIQTALNNISLLENKIRLYFAAMGRTDDKKITQTLNDSGVGVGNFFSFVSDSNGNIPYLNVLLNDSENDQLNANKEFLSTLDGQLKIKNIMLAGKFDFTYITANTTSVGDNRPSYTKLNLSEVYNSDYVKNLVYRIMVESGEKITENSFVSANGTDKYADLYKIYKNISSSLMERQILIKKAAGLVKNATEIKSINSDPSTQNALLSPDTSNYSDIPGIFENLIEDESFDEFGPGSGSRYIIRDVNIKSLNIKEHPPNFTSVAVIGSPGITIPQGAPGLNANLLGGTGSDTGNFQNSAVAVDYDMWRMYGFKSTQSFRAPFLQDPDTQCAPMAVSLLNKARSEIFSGSISIVGNEYMQPGDVVYLESRDTLFYVKTVQHSFNYTSKTFDTTLTVNYGRPPGEYIPTKMDLIGKVLYKNRETGSCVLHRHSNSYGDKPIGAIYVDVDKITAQVNANTENVSSLNEKDIAAKIQALPKSESDLAIYNCKYAEANKEVIDRILNELNIAELQNYDKNTNVSLKLKTTVYSLQKRDNPDHRLAKAVNNIHSTIKDKYKSITLAPLENINIKDISQPKSPSSYCRDLAKKVMLDSSSGALEEDIISKNIIDFFLVIEYNVKK